MDELFETKATVVHLEAELEEAYAAVALMNYNEAQYKKLVGRLRDTLPAEPNPLTSPLELVVAGRAVSPAVLFADPPPKPTTITWLQVPYLQKDDAKGKGAKWDDTEKKWFVPAGVDLDPFRKWCIGNRVHLDVPFHEKDDVKAKGAKWDAKRGQWFFTDNMNETPFNKWRRIKAPGSLTST